MATKLKHCSLALKFTHNELQHTPCPTHHHWCISCTLLLHSSLGIMLDNTLLLVCHRQNLTQTALFTNVISPNSAHHWLNLEPKSWSNLLSPHALVTVLLITIITCTKSTDHITLVLIQLHWLPVKYSILYMYLQYVTFSVKMFPSAPFAQPLPDF